MTPEPAPEIAQGVVRCYKFLPGGNPYLDEVLAGLALPRKRISPRYLFDEAGSRLHAAICQQPECYLVRTEVATLRDKLAAIAQFVGPEIELLEVRTGVSVQAALLMERLRPLVYVPIDVDGRMLDMASRELALLFPWLNISAMHADVCQRLALPEFVGLPIRRKVLLLPGSAIGGFAPEDALAVLCNARQLVGTGGALLAGIDLRKDAKTIVSAYGDANGLNAALRLNLLARINHELGGNFQPGRFVYRTSYDETKGRLGTFLESRYAQFAQVGGRRFDFARGETMDTGFACQYSVTDFHALAGKAGFMPQAVWTDVAQVFSIHGMIAV